MRCHVWFFGICSKLKDCKCWSSKFQCAGRGTRQTCITAADKSNDLPFLHPVQLQTSCRHFDILESSRQQQKTASARPHSACHLSYFMHRGKHGDDVSGMAPFRVQHRDLPLCGRFANVSVFESSSQAACRAGRRIEDPCGSIGSGWHRVCIVQHCIAEARTCHDGNTASSCRRCFFGWCSCILHWHQIGTFRFFRP